MLILEVRIEKFELLLNIKGLIKKFKSHQLFSVTTFKINTWTFPPSSSLSCFIFYDHDEPPGRSPYRPYLLPPLHLGAKTTRILSPSSQPTVDRARTIGAAVVAVAITPHAINQRSNRIFEFVRWHSCCCQTDSSYTPSNRPCHFW